MDGQDLMTELIINFDEKFKTLQFFTSFELFRELIKAVNYLPSKNIMHRDLNPGNVLISNGRNDVFLKLCDFGLAKPHEIEKHTAFVGTQSYMAPEVKDRFLDRNKM